MANDWKPTEEMWLAASNAGISKNGLNVRAALTAVQPKFADSLDSPVAYHIAARICAMGEKEPG